MDKKREVKNMDRNGEIFEVTKIMGNIKHNNFTVGDYKLCESESEVVMRALSMYLSDLKFDDLHVFECGLASAT